MTKTKELVQKKAQRALERAKENVTLAKSQLDDKYVKAAKALNTLVSNGELTVTRKKDDTNEQFVDNGIKAVEALIPKNAALSPAIKNFYAFKLQLQIVEDRAKVMDDQVKSVDKIFKDQLAIFEAPALDTTDATSDAELSGEGSDNEGDDSL